MASDGMMRTGGEPLGVCVQQLQVVGWLGPRGWDAHENQRGDVRDAAAPERRELLPLIAVQVRDAVDDVEEPVQFPSCTLPRAQCKY